MEATAHAIEMLRRAYPFQEVSTADLESLLPSFHLRHHDTGGVVWHPGDAAADLWFVLDGQVQAVMTSEAGAEVVPAVFGPGESFGHPALFAPGAQRVVSVVALVPTDLARLPREPLLRFLETHPAAMRRMLESMSLLMLTMSSQFSQVAFHDVRSRVALQLIKLADDYGQPVDGGGLRIPFRLSQATWAGMVATSRESANRALSGFVASGEIRQQGGHIIVMDRDRLRRVLGRRQR